jgi:hypothetical protein
MAAAALRRSTSLPAPIARLAATSPIRHLRDPQPRARAIGSDLAIA